METSNEVEVEVETMCTKTEDEEIDLSSKVQELLLKIGELEKDKQQIRDEFGHQRAKLKELYLQKEEELKRGNAKQNQLLEDVKKLGTELDEAKSQLLVAGFSLESDLLDENRKCQEEIASLQQIVQVTVEESSTSRSKFESEMKRLRRTNEKLELENQELKSLVQHQQQGTSDKGERDTPILAPGVMLSAVTKTLARKVVSQLGADASSASQDNLEDSMRKAQEDAEVLRSLVIPLEEEIQALKEKLRYTDQQLRKYEGDRDEPIKWTEEISDTTNKDSIPVGAQNGSNIDVASPSKDSSVGVSHNKINQTSVSLDSDGHQSQATTSSPKVNVMNTSLTSISSLNEPHATSLKRQSPDSHSSMTEDLHKSATEVMSEKDGESIGSPVSQNKTQVLTPCDMCSNYEAQLVRAQQRNRELEKQVATLERSIERYREDLAKESDFRKDMEEKWNEKKEEHKIQVAELKKQMENAEDTLQKLRSSYKQMSVEVLEQLTKLTAQREEVQTQINQLQKENDNLLGKHSKHSQQLQNEIIDLPDKVEDLHVLLLNFREELIAAKVAKEVIEGREQMLQSENHLLRDQMNGEREERENMEENLVTEMNTLRKRLHAYEKDCSKYEKTNKDLKTLVENSQKTATEFDAQLTEALNAKSQLEKQVNELRSRVGSLQQELDTSEAVQKDFVRLSQSLQVQLERIREADTQVRWQHDEDVEECQSCKTAFSFTRGKQHCRHCGRIFCINCLSHTVNSGPNQRPSKVCDVCHTLLVRDTAPYFSTEPPHTPD